MGHCSAKLNIFPVQLLQCGREKDLILGGPRDGRSICSCRKLPNPLKPDWHNVRSRYRRDRNLLPLRYQRSGCLGE